MNSNMMFIDHKTNDLEGCLQVYKDLGFHISDHDEIDGIYDCDEVLTSPCEKYPITISMYATACENSANASQMIVCFHVDDRDLAEKMKEKGYDIEVEEMKFVSFLKRDKFKVAMPDGLEIEIQCI